MEITDTNGRIGVVVEDRGDCIFAVPLWSSLLIDGVAPGGGKSKYNTATAWHKQDDGSYYGLWFDSPYGGFVNAMVSGDARDRIKASGEVLYGERWQTDLARDLGLSDGRRVRQWMAGERPIPAGVWSDIARLLHHRLVSIQSLLKNPA